MLNVDYVQFARLLDEINEVGLTEAQTKAIAKNINIGENDVRALLNRASDCWDDLRPIVEKQTPLNEEQVSEELAENGKVSAVVKMDFEEILGHSDVEDVLENIADRLTNCVTLSNLDYKVLFADNEGSLYLRVTGNVEEDEEELV